MTGSVAIITDSVSCLPKELLERYRITIVPIRLTVDGRVYRDSVDMTATEAYQMFLKNPDSFSTSPSSPGHFLDAYKEAAGQADSILCITLSSKLSTGYNMANIGREKAKTELPGISIEVMDSTTVTAAEGFIALAAARAVDNGGTLADAVKAAEEVREKVSFFALLDTIKHVYRTGRIPKIASQIGSALNIKPILSSSDGAIKFKGIVGSREKGYQKLLDYIREGAGNRRVHVGVMHGFAPDDAELLKERIAAEFDCAELWISEFTPVMGYATGTGTLAIAFYPD